VLVFACLTQIIALLILCLITKTNPLNVVSVYLLMSTIIFKDNLQCAMVHLSSMPWGILPTLLQWIITLSTVVFPLLYHMRKYSLPTERLIALTLINIFSLWSLLVLYHGPHDMVISLIFIALVSFRINVREPSHDPFCLLNKIECTLVYIVAALILVIWIFPIYRIVGSDIYRSAYTICTVIAFFVSLRFLFTIREPSEAK